MTSLVTSEEVERQASQQYAQVLAQAKQKGLLNQNPQQVRRVRTVAERLIAQVDVFREDAVNWKWEINLLTSKDVNAWCMPGGKIAVYTGLLERLQLTDDELAAVMGHEIAHALREHARERIGRQMATQTATVDRFGCARSADRRETRPAAGRHGVAGDVRAAEQPRNRAGSGPHRRRIGRPCRI